MAREGPNANAEIQGRLRSRDKLMQEQKRADLTEIMKTAAGRRFMYDLIFERCDLMNPYMLQDSGIYRHEGRRMVGHNLAIELQEFHSSEYVLMINERLRDIENERIMRSAAIQEAKKEIE